MIGPGNMSIFSKMIQVRKLCLSALLALLCNALTKNSERNGKPKQKKHEKKTTNSLCLDSSTTTTTPYPNTRTYLLLQLTLLRVVIESGSSSRLCVRGGGGGGDPLSIKRGYRHTTRNNQPFDRIKLYLTFFDMINIFNATKVERALYKKKQNSLIH